VKEYYHRRAAEYDEWWLGTGKWTAVERPGWEEELDEVAALLTSLSSARTLDVACGTGFITQHLPGEVTGLDQSEAMVAIAQERLPEASFVVGDALDLPFEDSAFDRVFTSYFYCHLEEPERRRFLAEARRVAEELVVMGSIARADERRAQWQERVLNDGTRWQVFKRVFDPAELAAELDGEVVHVGVWFVVVRS
jgi:demethylmenaquinone methyltransferase/2-methoxy-6-polyprenyl-1,4-benzoquinol methylase